MLRLVGGQVESLFDLGLPVEVRDLPGDLAALDELLEDRRLLAPIEAAWEQVALGHGRPTIAMTTFVRLMVIKTRTGWGYETLVREVSDSLHLRRFCLIALTERVPDESTVRKLTRRLGAEVVDEITRAVMTKATRERRFITRLSGSTRPSSRPTCAIPATPGSRATRRACWRARPPRRGGWRAPARARSVIARARPASCCARSTARSRAAPGRPRRPCCA